MHGKVRHVRHADLVRACTIGNRAVVSRGPFSSLTEQEETECHARRVGTACEKVPTVIAMNASFPLIIDLDKPRYVFEQKSDLSYQSGCLANATLECFLHGVHFIYNMRASDFRFLLHSLLFSFREV